MKIVMVEWIDSAFVQKGWQAAAEYRGERPAVMQTTGWLFEEDDESLTVVMSTDPTGGKVADAMVIPRPVVKNVTVLAK